MNIEHPMIVDIRTYGHPKGPFNSRRTDRRRETDRDSMQRGSV
ncbi:hypothetical protein [Bacillus glycinifermentans]|uniref:Uncharacterized protein n=1 Tax=Bacillus glycinifermentans TaxID=1664069 RepID=A0ABU6GWW2_9BACI|nr:hypothetical protein [Bacillus glycinifermentans]MEC0483271.1 hypothetical protein [Bacillus glycinifermentans]MEC0493108.1 hypothetical protein [Bacillus glycinifermentans]MEC0541408.1 hypothetical protein [Bacillus glycinifermentans]MEC3606718.1 hypothetical protein [Bacillus glycinifermentans]